MEKRKMHPNSLANLIPYNEQDADKARERCANGGKKAQRVMREKRTMRERFAALRDMELPEEEQTDDIITYGDAWAASISRMVQEGKAGAVEAMKLMLSQIGEDAPERSEVRIVYDPETESLMG